MWAKAAWFDCAICCCTNVHVHCRRQRRARSTYWELPRHGIVEHPLQCQAGMHVLHSRKAHLNRPFNSDFVRLSRVLTSMQSVCRFCQNWRLQGICADWMAGQTHLWAWHRAWPRRTRCLRSCRHSGHSAGSPARCSPASRWPIWAANPQTHFCCSQSRTASPVAAAKCRPEECSPVWYPCSIKDHNSTKSHRANQL